MDCGNLLASTAIIHRSRVDSRLLPIVSVQTAKTWPGVAKATSEPPPARRQLRAMASDRHCEHGTDREIGLSGHFFSDSLVSPGF